MKGWLADKSAVVRFKTSATAETWSNRVRRGLVRVSALTRLETGFSARSGDELRQMAANPPLVEMPILHLTPNVEERAMEVQSLLAEHGHHRAPSPVDLLVAAAAEIEGLTVLHLDKDFELIADITGQPTERLEVAVAA